jgi:hypothetical protein
MNRDEYSLFGTAPTRKARQASVLTEADSTFDIAQTFR